MARITLESIQAVLDTDGWTVETEKYQNLNEIMHFKCSEGHDVYAPYKEIRKNRHCPVCQDNYYKDQNSQVIPKKGHRILALDQSTNITAWSIFDDKKLIKYGFFVASGETSWERIYMTKMWFLSLVANWAPDFIGFEDIQLQSFGSNKNIGVTTYKILAHLQGVLANSAQERGIPFALAPTPSWRNHCGVKGRTRTDQKNSIRQLVKEWYDVTVSEDEADAIGIGKYTAEKLDKKPIKTPKLPKMIEF